MIWLVEVVINNYTRTTNLENVSGAHPAICHARDGADMPGGTVGGQPWSRTVGGEEE